MSNDGFNELRLPKSIGLIAVIEELGLKVPLPAVRSTIISGARKSRIVSDITHEYYPKVYAVNGLFGNLKFAMRYEPVDLAVLAEAFKVLDGKWLEARIREEPTGIYTRKIWYLYELLTGKVLDMPDVPRTGYIDLLNPALHITGKSKPVRRQFINDNLLGNAHYCPSIRRTETLTGWMSEKLDVKAKSLVETCDPVVLARAVNYLYTKETKSSFEIEGEVVKKDRAERFVAALSHVGEFDTHEKSNFIKLQNAIVDPRYAAKDYREKQNFVGQTMSDYSQQVHFVCPRPEDVNDLMNGWMDFVERLTHSEADVICAAAAAAFGFVFIHPFEDGNGRIHRFLLHHILAKMKFTPPELLFPISAVILRERRAYDKILESYSSSIQPFIDFIFDEDGTIKVLNETANLYRFWDATNFAEYLYTCVAETISKDLREELGFLAVFDSALKATMEIVDMPDQRATLLIRMILQNGGKLSKRKREVFEELTDEEILKIEKAIERRTTEYDSR